MKAVALDFRQISVVLRGEPARINAWLTEASLRRMLLFVSAIIFGTAAFGAAIGFDHLMDKNHKVWIYQSKLWAGFTVGLNLN